MPTPIAKLHLPDDLLSYREAAVLLDRSRWTVRQLVADGELETLIVGKRPVILRPSVLDYLRRQQAANRDEHRDRRR